MVCNHCGYDNPDGNNTCANCGNYLGNNPSPYTQPNQHQSNQNQSNQYQSNQHQPHQYQPNQWQQPGQAYYGQDFDDSTPLTTKQYVGMILLQMIPIAGFIMLLVWAFSKPGNINRRNYARGSLIVSAILFVIYIAIILLIVVAGIGMRSSYLYY